MEKQLAPPSDTSLTQTSPLPKTVAWMLFGGVAMIMAVFYLVSFNDKDIVDGTWLVISNAVSLFCAVLLFLSFREFVALITDGEEVRRLGPASDGWDLCWGPESGQRRLTDTSWGRRLAGPPTQKTLAVDGVCAVAMFVIWETILFLARKNAIMLSALGLIAAHCIGFSTLYAFGNMQQCAPFRDSPGFSILVAVMVVPALLITSVLGDFVRRKVASLQVVNAHEDHPVHNFLHQCLHTEREAMAFAVSFLLAQVLQYIATDQLAPLHAVPKGRDTSSAFTESFIVAVLFISVIALGFIEHVVASEHGHHDLEHDNHHGHEMSLSQLSLHMLKDTLAFTTGWCMLDGIKFFFWSQTNNEGLLGEGDVMTSHVVIVIISSVVTFVLFFIMDFAADRLHGHLGRGLRASGKAVMLLLGLAFEGAFWEGAHQMTAGLELEDKTSRMIAVIVFSLTFTAIVMPAWIMYIVPHTIELEGDEVHVKDYDDHVSPCAGANRLSIASSIASHRVSEIKPDNDHDACEIDLVLPTLPRPLTSRSQEASSDQPSSAQATTATPGKMKTSEGSSDPATCSTAEALSGDQHGPETRFTAQEISKFTNEETIIELQDVPASECDSPVREGRPSPDKSLDQTPGCSWSRMVCSL